ncbi:MAG: PilZ domain-containing protein [Gammaproteobacteria bacterium]|nr:PilZ domain-containing protein [Gammaproteobacteria bacterium]
MSSASQDERRNFHRILFDAACTLTTTDGTYNSTLMDVSLNGVLMATPEAWGGACGDQADLKIHLTDEEIISMDVEVTHQEQGHVGLRCIHIDMESISHLRRLVELNLGDPSLLERELSALG